MYYAIPGRQTFKEGKTDLEKTSHIDQNVVAVQMTDIVNSFSLNPLAQNAQ